MFNITIYLYMIIISTKFNCRLCWAKRRARKCPKKHLLKQAGKALKERRKEWVNDWEQDESGTTSSNDSIEQEVKSENEN